MAAASQVVSERGLLGVDGRRGSLLGVCALFLDRFLDLTHKNTIPTIC